MILAASAAMLGFATLWFTSANLWASLGIGLALAGLVLRWHQRLVRQGLPPNARERLAMRLAWRRGGRITVDELAQAGLNPHEARATLEALCARGLCRADGDGYRFYNDPTAR
ncbi:protein BatD [Marinithermus hydrothermalis]|uniref:protein BatD n=1 Tax=Marinithermus hydrothermalis TaxID=186192 RepID=UPI0011D2201A|nr:protein BatD [Marinithermus hydrothermalis]